MTHKCLKLLTLLLSVFLIYSCKNEENKMLKSETNKDTGVIVGTYTNAGSEGIYKLIMNSNGNLYKKQLLVKVENPSFLAVSKRGEFVYAVQENEIGKVFAYKWNEEKNRLIEIENMETAGKHPCYVSLNHNNKSIAFANYSSGNIGFVEVNENGGFKSDIQVKQHKGKGTLLPNQEKPHAHCTKFYKNNFLYAVDLGIDKVLKYTIDNNEMIKSEIVLESKNGDGFRHLIFHPTKNISYVVNEFSNSVMVSQIEKETGVFNKIQQVSTLPKGYEKESFAADIQISNDGKFLYISNRGQNSIAIFSIDIEGLLTFITTESVRGNWPRNFMLTKDNNFLLVANQFSNNIVVFKRDENTGMLEYTGNQLEMSLPVFLSEL